MSAPVIDPSAPKTVLADTSANPAPLGLCAFGLTTFLLNAHNAGFFPLDSMIIGMGLFYGGMTQLFVGWMEWKKGASFGTIAFTSYGMFWIVLCTLIMLPKTSLGIAAATPTSMAFFLGIWGAMSAVLYYCTLRTNTALQITFAGVVVLFALLTLANVFHGTEIGHTFHTLAGWEGMFTAFAAMYTGLAQLVNEMYGKVKWPLNKA
ncbi:MAG: acetate uptake transporter [Rhodospirillaceae bacterium]|nr:acetate uptake transporter [Rhodospirillaceae bacterium]